MTTLQMVVITVIAAVIVLGFSFAAKKRDTLQSEYWGRNLITTLPILILALGYSALVAYTRKDLPHLFTEVWEPVSYSLDASTILWGFLLEPELYVLAAFTVWTAICLLTLFLTDFPVTNTTGIANSSLDRSWLRLHVVTFAVFLLLTIYIVPITSYPIMIWTGSVIIFFIILAIYLDPDSSDYEQQYAVEQPPSDWVTAMKQSGYDLRLLQSVDGTEAEHVSSPPGFETINDTLATLFTKMEASHQYAPLTGFSSVTRESGEYETLVEMASNQASQARKTLVVVPENPGAYLARLAPKVPNHVGVKCVDTATLFNDVEQHQILIVDLKVFDKVLASLRASMNLDENQDNVPVIVGLIAWLDIQKLDGFAAVQFKFLAYRLHRILDITSVYRPNEIVFASVRPQYSDMVRQFVNWAMPFPTYDVEVREPITSANTNIEWYEIIPTRDTQRNSVDLGTYIYRISHDIADVTTRTGHEFYCNEVLIEDRYRDLKKTNCGDASVLFSFVKPTFSMIAEGSDLNVNRTRSTEKGIVGVIPHPGYPYAMWAYSMALKGEFNLWLLQTTGNQKVIERSMLMALMENEDDIHGLRRTFQWDDQTILRVIEDSQEDIRQQPARFLSKNRTLEQSTIWSFSAHSSPRIPEWGPQGNSPVKVVDIDAETGAPPLMYIDRERLTIETYPDAFITINGTNYSVRPWDTSTISSITTISLIREEEAVKTHRSRISEFKPDSNRPSRPQNIGGSALSLSVRHGTYTERLNGVIKEEVTWMNNQISVSFKNSSQFAPVNSVSFDTQALTIWLGKQVDERDCATIAAILEDTLQVHYNLGAGEFETVANVGTVDVVDLRPGGTGIAWALAEEGGSLSKVFAYVRMWLESCGCTDGCEKCLKGSTYKIRGALAGKKSVLKAIENL